MIYSHYFGKEIDLTTGVATGVGGKKNKIVYHYELENVINTLCKDVACEFTVCNANPNDIVVICKMSGGEWGKSVSAIGEATPETLKSSVEKAYPTTIAFHRAFDRAAIKFLELGPHIYSNMEMEPDGPRTVDAKNLVDAHQDDQRDAPDTIQNGTGGVKESGATNDTDAKKNASNAKTEPVEKAFKSAPDTSTAKPQSQPMQGTQYQQSRPSSQPQQSRPQSPQASTLDTLGATVIEIGNKKGKTIAELFALKDAGDGSTASWISFITESYKPTDPEKIKQVEAIKKYAKLRNA